MHLLTGKILRLLINCILLSFLLFSFTASLAKTTLEALPHRGDQSIIAAIHSAKKNIQITMYGFTDEKIAKALIQQHASGVYVQVLIEREPYQALGENSHIIQLLKTAHIAVHYASSTFSLTHQKTILIDNKQALILTGNFTYSGFYRQRNFIVNTNNADIVESLHRLFIADWNQTGYSLSQHSSLVLSPDNSWEILHAFIHATQQQLDIYALELTDKRVIRELLKKKPGVIIRIMTSSPKNIAQKNKLCRQHIEVHQLKKLQQHSKALLRDYNSSNALAYVGSVNLSYPSLSKNREVGLLFSDKTAIAKLNKTFETDWKNSDSVC